MFSRVCLKNIGLCYLLAELIYRLDLDDFGITEPA